MKKAVKVVTMLIFTILATATYGADREAQPKSKKAMVQELTLAEFQKKVYDLTKSNATTLNYLGDKPAIVDFYASWCGPCRMVAPILEELAEEYDGKIVIYKVNTEREADLAAAFGIRSIPSILFIPKEGQPQMLQGAMPKQAFKQAIEEYLLK